MKLKYHLAKTLRRTMTSAEFLLWERIRVRQPGGPIFRRQYPFGPYIIDFYCIRAKLAVEVDGLVHDRNEQAARDERRDAFMRTYEVLVYRIPAGEIYRNLDETADGIWDLATERLRSVPG